MANGDLAAARGWPLVASTADRRNGWTEINKSRDYAATAAGLADAAQATATSAQATATSAQSAAATASAGLAGKSDVGHTHDDRYYTEAEVNAGYYSKGDVDYINSGTHPTLTVRSDGPSPAAYGRAATGSGYYAVYMNSSYQFMRNTSSRRYKEDEQPFEIDARALLEALVPTTYHRKGQPDGTRELGLIAEDLVDLPHLVQWDYPRDADGNLDESKAMVPEAVRYEQVLPVMLVHVCREQQQLIDALTARVETLEGKL